MLCVESGQEEEKSDIGTSSQDDHLFPTLEGQDTKVSTLKHRAPSPDGSPEAKKARMGSIKQLNSSTCSQSVAERLKESTLKLQEKSTQNGSTVSVAEVKSPFPVFTGQKDLNEEQLNQVRVIAQHLKELGLRDAVTALVEETGCKIEHTYASQIRKCVKSGQWDEALAILDKSVDFITPKEYDAVRLEFLLHKILDIAESGDMAKVIWFMRKEGARYKHSLEWKELMKLPFYSVEQLKKMPLFRNYRSKGYLDKVAKTVEKLLPASFMLEENRLEGLFDKALKHQLNNCPYHMLKKEDEKEAAECIVRDHGCTRGKEEIHDGQRILCHEVHSSAFSPNGKFFITGATTRRVHLYKCMKNSGTLKHLRNLKPRSITHRPSRVCDIAWSTDSRFVAIAGSTKDQNDLLRVIVYDLTTQKIHTQITKTVANVADSLICFSWNSYKLAVGDETGRLEVFDITMPTEKDAILVCKWEGLRIRRIRSLRNGNFLALDTHNRVRLYSLPPNKRDETVIREVAPVTNFILHKSEKLVLTLAEKSFHLWDITEGSLVRNFRTFPMKDIVIEGAFGGPNEEYFVVGTPDGRLIVYSINDTEPIIEVKGHYGYLNTVSWHPKSGMITTCGTDSILRVWHIGCELEQCVANVVQVLPPRSQKQITRSKERAEKKVKKELEGIKKERKKRNRRLEREAEANRIYEEQVKQLELTPNSISAQLAPLGRAEFARALMPLPTRDTPEPRKPRKKKREKKTEELMDVGAAIRMSYELTSDAYREQAPLLDLETALRNEQSQSRKKKDRKRKRKRSSKKHQDGTMSMEVDESSNGKAGPSGSDNGSIRSNL